MTPEQAHNEYYNSKYEYEDMEEENYVCKNCGDTIEGESNVCWENEKPFCSKECIYENKQKQYSFKLTTKFGSERHLI